MDTVCFCSWNIRRWVFWEPVNWLFGPRNTVYCYGWFGECTTRLTSELPGIVIHVLIIFTVLRVIVKGFEMHWRWLTTCTQCSASYQLASLSLGQQMACILIVTVYMYTVRSESNSSVRLRNVGLVVSLEVALKCAVVSLYSVVKQRLKCNNGKVCNCLIQFLLTMVLSVEARGHHFQHLL
jgi:hypothetical protein